jgi:hypothetical protein
MRRSGVFKLYGKGICQLASLCVSTAPGSRYILFHQFCSQFRSHGVGLSNLLCYNSK